MSATERGVLIVMEGCDKTGKSTQARRLVRNLQRHNIKAKYMSFPDRSTAVGQVINQFLLQQHDLSVQAAHLLFSANRWECHEDMLWSLIGGTTLVVDRYCYSGVAYSIANGLDSDWCKLSDSGLLRPDRVFFLDESTDVSAARDDYGGEVYERPAFQKRVRDAYLTLRDDKNWFMISGGLDINAVEQQILAESLNVVQTMSNVPLVEMRW